MHTKLFKITLGILLILFLFSTEIIFSEIETDEVLLAKIQKDSFKYFLDFTPEETGLTCDSSAIGSPCSIAAVGFYLASLTIATENNWITKQNAYERAKTVLNSLKNKAHGKNGFFYHFIDPKTGKRVWGSEVSSIDTALLMAGVLLVGDYFKGTPIETTAKKLYENVQWDWMLNNSSLISHGYKPESGFLPYYWDTYSEHLILQALAIGSPTHPIPPHLWNEWNRFEEYNNDKRIVYSFTGSLFTYQFSHAFIDFRKLYDMDINYFENSTYATLANKNFCKNLSSKYITYENNYWGLTACLGPSGYKAYGAKPGRAYNDGTIAPYGSISSIVFTPEKSISALNHLYNTQKEKLYGQYGFKDAFNLDRRWFARKYLAIDQGITILMIENYRSELIWKYFMKLTPIKRWIDLCGLNKKNS